MRWHAAVGMLVRTVDEPSDEKEKYEYFGEECSTARAGSATRQKAVKAFFSNEQGDMVVPLEVLPLEEQVLEERRHAACGGMLLRTVDEPLDEKEKHESFGEESSTARAGPATRQKAVKAFFSNEQQDLVVPWRCCP